MAFKDVFILNAYVTVMHFSEIWVVPFLSDFLLICLFFREDEDESVEEESPVKAKVTPSKQQNGKSPKPGTPAKKQVMISFSDFMISISMFGDVVTVLFKTW